MAGARDEEPTNGSGYANGDERTPACATPPKKWGRNTSGPSRPQPISRNYLRTGDPDSGSLIQFTDAVLQQR